MPTRANDRMYRLPAYIFLTVLVLALFNVPMAAASLYRDYDAFMTSFKSLANAYPEMVTYESVGKTVKNNDIIMFKIGNPEGGKVLFDGAMHASETLGSEVLYSYAKWLLTSNDPLAAQILAGTCTLLVPALNVDSYNRYRTNAHYVDLNRNFATNWANSGPDYVSDPHWGYYHGTGPLSEPESQTIVRLFQTLKPSFYVNLHYPGGSYYLGSYYANRTYNSLIVNKINSLSAQRGVKPYGYAETNRAGFAVSDAGRAGITSFLLELTTSTTIQLSQIESLLLPKFIPIAGVLSLESANNVLFTDSFESRDFRNWDGSLTTTGTTLTVGSRFSRQGAHSEYFSSVGSDTSEAAYCYKKFAASASLSARGYFLGISFVTTGDNSRFYFAAFASSDQLVAMAGVRKIGTVTWWRLAVRNGTEWVVVESVASQFLNCWHRFEIQWTQSTRDGYGKLYVDDKLVCSVTHVNTSAFGAVDSARFGVVISGNAKTASYLDYVQLSESSQGPLPLIEDLNQDGRIDMLDVSICAHAFYTFFGDANWDSRADLNADSRIDLVDMAHIATSYGENIT